MKLKKIITKDVIIPHIKSLMKNEIIYELLEVLIKKGKIKEEHKEDILYEILKRESYMSTGLKAGLAMPHCKTDLINDIKVAVGMNNEGVDFSSFDGEPSVFFVLIISPKSKPAPHIQVMSEISKIFDNEKKRTELLKSKTVDEIYNIIAG